LWLQLRGDVVPKTAGNVHILPLLTNNYA